jgi:hypothetical protein
MSPALDWPVSRAPHRLPIRAISKGTREHPRGTEAPVAAGSTPHPGALQTVYAGSISAVAANANWLTALSTLKRRFLMHRQHVVDLPSVSHGRG